MKMAKWILPLLLLVGCGEGYIDNNYGYGYHYDEADIETGLRVRYHPTARFQLSLAELTLLYKDIQSCAGLSAPAPLVIFTDTSITAPGPNGDITRQAFYFYSGTVIYNADLFLYMSMAHMRHESLHHLLAMNGESDEDNYNHRSSLFEKCEQPD